MVLASRTRLRTQPSIWASWLAPLLAGDTFCTWAVWYKVHFLYTKMSNFDATRWMEEHTPLVLATRDMLVDEGFIVTIENENSFTLESNGIVLAGKPDLVAVRDDQVLVVDCKTGAPRTSHRSQLLTYMAVLPCAWKALSNRPVNGMLQYKQDNIMVPASAVDQTFRMQLREMIHLVGRPQPPARHPSRSECQLCSISKDDCPDRMDGDALAPVTDHGLF